MDSPLGLQGSYEGQQEVLLGEQLSEQRQSLLYVGLHLDRKRGQQTGLQDHPTQDDTTADTANQHAGKHLDSVWSGGPIPGVRVTL